jgi:SNF2 family DNA or RNA helicase
VYRIGQAKQVYIYKFFIQDSIEERILEIQQEKQMRSDTALGDDSSQLFGTDVARQNGLSVRDLQHIFGRRNPNRTNSNNANSNNAK